MILSVDAEVEEGGEVLEDEEDEARERGEEDGNDRGSGMVVEIYTMSEGGLSTNPRVSLLERA